MEVEELTNKSNEELKKEYEELFSIIYESECYGLNDLRLFYLIEKILNEKGIEFKIKNKIIWLN